MRAFVVDLMWVTGHGPAATILDELNSGDPNDITRAGKRLEKLILVRMWLVNCCLLFEFRQQVGLLVPACSQACNNTF